MISLANTIIRSIFHFQFISAFELFLKESVPFKIQKEWLSVFLFFLVILKELSDYILQLPGDISDKAMIGRELLTLFITFSGFIPLIIFRKKINKKVAAIILTMTAVIAVLISFMMTLSIEGLSAPVYKHFVDIIIITLTPIVYTPLVEKFLEKIMTSK